MQKKFYLQTWFICLMIALWPFLIPGVIGIVLLIKQIIYDIKIKKIYGEASQLQNKINDLNCEVSQIQAKIYDLNYEKSQLRMNKDSIQKEITKLKNDLSDLYLESLVKSYDFTDYDGVTSEECKNKISLLKLEEQELIKNGNFIIMPSAKPTKEMTNNTKQLLRCFSAECDNALLNISVKNIDTQRNKIQKSFETLNKIFETDNISLSRKALEMKLEMLTLAYTYDLKKEQEREQQKAIREQMVEEEKVLREVEREKQKIEKEEAQFKGELSKMMEYMRKTDSDVEKNIYIDKIKELEDKLRLVEKDKHNVFEREQNTRAGFVYIISNIGSFGENVYKIGMTRRLEPMDRINELSSASVPFPFDVHAMIFTADAPALETELHQYFRAYEINKVNQRKEFFRIDIKEIEDLVKKKHDATVAFTLLAKASEYRASVEKSS